MNMIESFELEKLWSHTKFKKNYNISLLLEHTMYIHIFSITFLFFKIYHSKCLTRLLCLFIKKNILFVKFL